MTARRCWCVFVSFSTNSPSSPTDMARRSVTTLFARSTCRHQWPLLGSTFGSMRDQRQTCPCAYGTGVGRTTGAGAHCGLCTDVVRQILDDAACQTALSPREGMDAAC